VSSAFAMRTYLDCVCNAVFHEGGVKIKYIPQLRSSFSLLYFFLQTYHRYAVGLFSQNNRRQFMVVRGVRDFGPMLRTRTITKKIARNEANPSSAFAMRTYLACVCNAAFHKSCFKTASILFNDQITVSHLGFCGLKLNPQKHL